MDSIRSPRSAWARRLAQIVLAAACGLGSAVPAGFAAEPEAIRWSAVGQRIVPGLEEPLIATGDTTVTENAALDAAIAAFHQPPTAGDEFAERAKPLAAFLAAHPASAWRMAIMTDLGLGYYRAGYFTKATALWEEAWVAGRNATDPNAKALMDRALGELIRLHTRLGHAERAQSLLEDMGARTLSGSATESLTAAREGLWLMRNDPGNAFLCGPLALKSLRSALDVKAHASLPIEKFKSGPNGVSLAELGELADKAGLAHRLVFRQTGQAIPVPSVVHWSAKHFAAIVGKDNDRYHIKDPTVPGVDLWVSAQALDAEASGYFLVPRKDSDKPVATLREVSLSEASSVRGTGNTPTNVPEDTKPDDEKTCSGGPGKPPMCVYSVHTMVVSLSISDTPVGYTPARGPAALTTLTYNQREVNQPAVFPFFNISPKWTLNWLSYIQDDPNAPGANVMRYVAGGGSLYYGGYSPGTGTFAPETRASAILTRIGDGSYQRTMPDGSVETYARSDGATGYPRRIFLTRKTDPQGNHLDLTYDGQTRLISVIDATGRKTELGYGVSGKPLLVSSITDPFGRTARLAYDSGGHLEQITDVIGITSRFAYDSAGLINSLTTPYGTSTFAYAGDGNYRWLEATDPLGKTERFEFVHGAPGIPFSEAQVPVANGLNPFNAYINYRNTYYWDRHASQVARGDYTQARIEHWLHDYATGYTSGVLESLKRPLEGRIWYGYRGQPSIIYNGDLDSPIAIARVLDDGSTQAQTLTYNAIGRPLTTIDAVGRRTVFTYAPNDVDLITVQQQVAAGALATIASFTYGNQHLPLTYTDAAGQTTRYSYNADGQRTSVINALNQVTRYNYDGFGRLSGIINAIGIPQETRTYDAYDRVATVTDSEGYMRAYTYDALDRITEIRYPDGTTTQYTYDRLDMSASKDRLNRTTHFAYDANRRQTAVTDPLNGIVRYGYYENGVLESITDANGNVTRWDIDVQSRAIAKRYANGTAEAYAYEPASGRIGRMTDALNQVKTYGYTADDRVASMSYTNTIVATAPVTFAYDPLFPRVVRMIDGIGTTTFEYAPVGAAGALEMTREDGPYNNDTVVYGHDALGRVSSRIIDTATESFTYDALGRVTTHASPFAVFARTYLGQTGQITSQISASGLGTRWTYQGSAGDRRLLSISNSGQARNFTYATTPEDLISGITESVENRPQRNWSYSYDATERLVKAQSSSGAIFSYGYDNADNLTSSNGASATVNSVNQLVSSSGRSYIYDANGNLTDDNTRTYRWDAENRLVGIGYKAQPTVMTTFRYDGMGRRLAIIDTNQFGPSETRLLWCGDRICQARSAADTVVKRYFREGQVNPKTQSLLYYGTDNLGSVRNVLALPTGVVVASYDYDPYGSPTSTINSRLSTDLRFAGMFYHGLSGLYLANHRVYSPQDGRWLSKDPIKELGGLNLYSYVQGKVTSNVDPLGLAGNSCPTEEECEQQAQADEAVCRNLPNSTPEEKAIRSRCWESVQERYGACVANRPIPQLVTWREKTPDPTPSWPSLPNIPVPPPPPWWAPLLPIIVIPWPGNPVYGGL